MSVTFRVRLALGVVCAFCALLSGLGCHSRRSVSSTPRIASSAYVTASQCFPVCSPGYSCERGVCMRPCAPACRAGWACSEGSCVPLCNPPCAPGYHCAETRTCEPGPARPATGSEPTQEWLPAPPEPDAGVRS